MDLHRIILCAHLRLLPRYIVRLVVDQHHPAILFKPEIDLSAHHNILDRNQKPVLALDPVRQLRAPPQFMRAEIRGQAMRARLRPLHWRAG